MSLTQSSKMNSTEENCSSWTVVTKKRSPKMTAQSTNSNGKINIDVKKKPTTKKATKSFVTKETMMIEPEMVGFVAGRKGCKLKRFQEIYGVKTSLPPKGGSQIVFEGPAKMVSAAKKEIFDNLSCKTSFSIEKDYTWLLIGPDGEKIQALEDAFNVKIVSTIGDEQVVITGVRCEEAKKAIEEDLSSITSFFIEEDYRYLVIGPLGETICALKKAHNVDIFINKEGKVAIIGKESEEAKKAIESLIEKCKIANPFKEKFSVPESTASSVCGENGSNVKRIESMYNVLVFISQGKDTEPGILVIGTAAENVLAAKQDILESLVRMGLDVDENIAERIIGRGGDAVRRLENEFDVSIHNVRESKGKAYMLEKNVISGAVISIISEEPKEVPVATIDESL